MKILELKSKAFISRLYHLIFYLKSAVSLCSLKVTRRYLPYRGSNVPLMRGWVINESLFRASVKNLEELINPYTHEFRWFIGKVYNGAFGSVDIELYYSMIRKYKPKLIIEIGSGCSTHFAMDALRKNRKGRFISIDPQPTRSLPKEVKQIRSKVEEVRLDFFEQLRKNDILFFDSSHTTKEAEYHIKKILPKLKEGVIIHHHDFLYPYAIYYQNDPKVFGEPDVLLNFYRHYPTAYKILICASYVRDRYPEVINKVIKSYHWDPSRLPASLWVRKIK